MDRWLCEGQGQGDELRAKEAGMSQGSNGDGELMRGLGSSYATLGDGNFSLVGYLMAPSFPPLVSLMSERKGPKEKKCVWERRDVKQTREKRVRLYRLWLLQCPWKYQDSVMCELFEQEPSNTGSCVLMSLCFAPSLLVDPYSSSANTECLVAMAAAPSDAEWSCVFIDVTNFALAGSKIIRTYNGRSKVCFGISTKGQWTYDVFYYRRQMKCEQRSSVWCIGRLHWINMAEEFCIVLSGMD